MDVRLVPLSAAHLDSLRAVCRDPAVLRFTRIPDPVPDGFAETWVARYEQGRREGTKDAFAIEDSAGAFLGLALVPERDREAREAELGYLVAPEARGRGVASEGLRLLTEWAFRELDLARAVLYISTENEGSQGVARNAGYTYEGTLRQLYVKPGLREDNQLWSRLSTDV